MPETLQVHPARKESKFRKYGIDRLLQGLGFGVFWVALLFVSAGTVHWLRGWICAISYVATMLTVGVVIWRLNPGLFTARAKWRSNRGTKPFDKIILPIYFPLTIAQPAVAGLDSVRFRWSSMPFWTLYAGLALFFAGIFLMASTMAVNPWAEATVRIQTDRGQQVVRTGPYRFVRHPMYVGMILMYFSIALMLGSMWALAIGALMAALLVIRTAFEDRTLRRELPGYEEFATTVTRWRLLPGIW
jgi:protein-S-isoprenylcysteine O-methyltransferase Ste14